MYQGIRRVNLLYDFAVAVIHSSSTALEALGNRETLFEMLSRDSSAFRGASEDLWSSIVVNSRSDWVGELESWKAILVALMLVLRLA